MPEISFAETSHPATKETKFLLCCGDIIRPYLGVSLFCLRLYLSQFCVLCVVHLNVFLSVCGRGALLLLLLLLLEGWGGVWGGFFFFVPPVSCRFCQSPFFLSRLTPCFTKRRPFSFFCILPHLMWPVPGSLSQSGGDRRVHVLLSPRLTVVAVSGHWTAKKKVLWQRETPKLSHYFYCQTNRWSGFQHEIAVTSAAS